MKEILIISACLPLYVINSFCDKYVSSLSGNQYNHLYNFLKFLAGSICLIPMFLSDSAPRFKAGALICGIICGIMYAVSKTVMLTGYEKTSIAFMTLCHSAGLIIPCILGHFFWSEKLNIFSVTGMLLTVISIIVLKSGSNDKKKYRLKGIAAGIIIFLTSGGVMVIQKLMGLYFKGQSISAYNFYSFAAAFLILSFFIKPKKISQPPLKKLLLCTAGSALSLCIISLVMTSLAGSVPSILLFPLFNGSGIILVCIGSAFFFKEKMTLKKSFGLLLGILGLCLVNI